MKIPIIKSIGKLRIKIKTSNNLIFVPNEVLVYTPKNIGINNNRVVIRITTNFFIYYTFVLKNSVKIEYLISRNIIILDSRF